MRTVGSSVALVLFACWMVSCGGGGSTSSPITLALGDNTVTTAGGGGGGGGNGRPISVPGASPIEGSVPQLVHLFDDGSNDPDGEIVQWEWNLGDRGWHDYTHTQGDVWHTFDHPGKVVAHLRVTDNDGKTATQFVQITLTKGGGPQVIDSLKVISPSDGYVLETVDNGTFTFRLLPMADPGLLVPGDVAIFMHDGGYLRVIDSVTQSGDILVVETSDAALEDVFESGALSHTFSMAGAYEKPPKEGSALANGVTHEVSDLGEISIDLSGTKLYEDDHITIEITDGLVQFTPSIDIGAEFEWFELTHFHTTATGELFFNFDVLVTADWSAEIEKEVEILTVEKPFVFVVGPVPIIGVATLTFIAGIEGSGNIHGEAGFGFDSTTTAKVGAEYNRGIWSPIAEWDSEFNEHPPYIEADLEAYLRAYVRPELEVVFYNTLAPKIDMEPWLRFDAEGTLLPCLDIDWELNGGATSDVFFKIDIFGYNIADFEERILDWSILIAEGRIATPCITAVEPLEGSSGSEVTFNATNEGAEADSWNWYFGEGASPPTSTEESPTVILGTAGTYDSCYVIAQNSFGVSEFPFVLTVSADTQAPFAVLNVEPDTGFAPLAVSFDASGSYDPDGSIVDYEWDFNGNGIFNETGDEANAQGDATPENTYLDSGTYHPVLRVTDNDGATDTETVEIYVSAPSGGQGDWWAFGRDAVHSSLSIFVGPDSPSLAWKANVGASVTFNSAVIANDGTAHMTSLDNNLYAINPDGSIKWVFPTGSRIRGSAMVGLGGNVFFASQDGYFYSVDPLGTEQWSHRISNRTDDAGCSPMQAPDGTVYIGSNEGAMYAFTSSGSLKWTYQTGDGIHSSPALGSDGTVYFGSLDHYLYALNPDGTLKWRFLTSWRIIQSSPAIADDGTVYIGTTTGGAYSSHFYAVNPDGSLKWQTTTDGYVYSSPGIAANGTVYFSDVRPGSGSLYAFSPSGTQLWKLPLGDESYSSPSIDANGTIYIGSGYVSNNANAISAINPDGTFKWRYTTPGWVISSPTITEDGLLLFGCRDGNLYALNDGSSGG